jgi:hypothetical protein
MAAAFHRSRAMALALLVASAPAAAIKANPQAPPPTSPPTGLIVGKTVDGVTGDVIGGAIVSISRAAPPAGAIRTEELAPAIPVSTRVISDSNGRFMFHELAAGAYTVSATKPGYIDGSFGRRFATDVGSQPMVLRDGERRGDVALSLWKRATVSGTVLDEAGEPVIGLQVRVFKRAVVGGVVRFTGFGNHPITDDRGVYRMSELAPGDYIVAVVTTQTTMPDSLQAAYAAASKAGTQQEFQRELDRSRGLSSGLGAAASGQRIGSWLLQTPLGFGSSSEIAAPPIAAGRIFVYPTVFYPAATSPSTASIISLGPGDERSTIDFQLRPVVTSRVSGVLTGPNGPEALTAIDLIPASFDTLQRDYDFAAASTTTDGTGAFVFLGVPPGAYEVRALKIPPRPTSNSSFTTVIQTGTSTIMSGGGVSAPPAIPSEPTYWASAPMTVGESDVTDMGVTFRTGARLSGRIEFDGVAAKPTTDRLMQISVQVSNADARTTSTNQFTLGRGVIDASGNFKTYQLPAGRYVVRGPALPNWTFKGAFLNGRDVSDTPLELDAEDVGNIVLTYSDRPTEIIGTARGNGEPDEMATILVFPAQPNLWINHGPTPRRFKTVRAGAGGVFRATSMPAGDYVVVGVHGTFPSEWQDPAFLRKLMALGTRTTVADGEIKTLDVTTREIK